METSISDRLAFIITSEEKDFLKNFIEELYSRNKDVDMFKTFEHRYSLRSIKETLEYSIRDNLNEIRLSFDEKLSLKKLLDERYVRVKGEMINISQKKILRQIINKLNDSILSEFFYGDY